MLNLETFQREEKRRMLVGMGDGEHWEASGTSSLGSLFFHMSQTGALFKPLLEYS